MKPLMRSVILAAAATAATALGGGGCEDKPEIPQAILDEANKPKENPAAKRPTTQELTSGRRTRSPLTPLPLTMEVPPSWTQGEFKGIKNPGNLLQGYTPAGEVQIDFASRPSIKQEDFDRVLEGAKKEMAKNPSMKVQLRPLGDIKILERQSVGPAKPLTLLDEAGQPHTSVESNFKWTISVLVPHEGAFQVYELNFIGLTKSQYDKDKEFLEGILGTLQYAGDTGGGTAPPPTPATTTAP
jgi:hypothetical protein